MSDDDAWPMIVLGEDETQSPRRFLEIYRRFQGISC